MTPNEVKMDKNLINDSIADDKFIDTEDTPFDHDTNLDCIGNIEDNLHGTDLGDIGDTEDNFQNANKDCIGDNNSV